MRVRSTVKYSGDTSHRDHVKVAEKALGKRLPRGAEVHHVDGNGLNNANTNLVICQDRAYHILLHVRTKLIKAGGNPLTQKLCSVCRQPKDFEAFALNTRNRLHGRQPACRECHVVLERLRPRCAREGCHRHPRRPDKFCRRHGSNAVQELRA
jgi:hypothetical protein